MPVPICPLLLQARATMAGGEMYADPTKAPGVACIGSRCAAWRSAPDDVSMKDGRKVYTPTHRGRCGMSGGDEHRDPAQEVPRG